MNIVSGTTTMQPRGHTIRSKRQMTVVQLLEWAFRVECAEIETDPFAQIGGTAMPGVGTEYLMMQRAALGCVAIDTSRGRSRPHDDAEVVAAVVEALPAAHGGISMAIHVASLARAGRTPDWMKGAVTRVVPQDWRTNRSGRHPATAVCGEAFTMRAGRSVRHVVRYTPVTYTPTASQIASARRAYLDWWGALLDIQYRLLCADLVAHDVTRVMPPLTPWR